MVTKYFVFNRMDELILKTSNPDTALDVADKCGGYILTKDDMKALDKI